MARMEWFQFQNWTTDQQGDFETIAMYSPHTDDRIKAVGLMNDTSKLREIARTFNDETARAAQRRIDDLEDDD